MQMRKYFIYFITLQCSSTTKLILRGLCDVWVENINSILLTVYKFFTADKKTGKPSFLTDSVFCFFFNAKALYIWGRHAWCGCHRFVLLLPVLCVKVQFCKEGLFSSPHLCLELQLMWLVFGPPDGRVWSASLHEQGDIPPPHHSVAQQEPVQRIIRRKNIELRNFSCFFLLLFLFLGYSATSSVLSILNHCMETEDCHLFLSSFESQYSNNSVIM